MVLVMAVIERRKRLWSRVRWVGACWQPDGDQDALSELGQIGIRANQKVAQRHIGWAAAGRHRTQSWISTHQNPGKNRPKTEHKKHYRTLWIGLGFGGKLVGSRCCPCVARSSAAHGRGLRRLRVTSGR